MRSPSRLLAITVAAFAAIAGPAHAHAHVSPSVVEAGHSESFTVVVPTEGDAPTTEVSVTVPEGFQIGSFEAAPGWKRTVDASGEGDEAIVSKVTWTGGSVPEGEAAYLRFEGEAADSGDYPFEVRQTYANGKVEDWAGAADGEEPAPVVSVEDSLGGGTDPLTIVALVLAGLALLAALISVGTRAGRPLT